MTLDEARQHIEVHCGKGWLPLVDKAFDRLPPGLTIACAFQKYGRLKFDTTARDEAYDEYLSDIADESAAMCEVCGEAASEQIVDGWVTTLCDPHFAELSNKG
ncbi:hypothetical protein PRJ39_16490 [Lysobacter enzymogenes]|uniref:hypothetical protein n=1 Tax=Lysobacter enzymogenes TaxID=69 RepID=UPI003749A8D4